MVAQKSSLDVYLSPWQSRREVGSATGGSSRLLQEPMYAYVIHVAFGGADARWLARNVTLEVVVRSAAYLSLLHRWYLSKDYSTNMN